MTPINPLLELLGRVGASQGNNSVLVSAEELHQWPSAAVKALKSQRLIVEARPASSAACPGCERNCVMPVYSLPAAKGSSSSFIVCDKRSDVNRVPVSFERLKQWQCNADLACEFVATSLGLRRSARQTDISGRWEIGTARGDKRSQMLCLEANGTLALVAGNNKIPLVELIEFHDGKYSLNVAMIRGLADSAATADNRYTPSNARREARKLNTQAMYEAWRKEYRRLKKRHPNASDVWISQKIAKLEIAYNRKAETIRKKMKK